MADIVTFQTKTPTALAIQKSSSNDKKTIIPNVKLCAFLFYKVITGSVVGQVA